MGKSGAPCFVAVIPLKALGDFIFCAVRKKKRLYSQHLRLHNKKLQATVSEDHLGIPGGVFSTTHNAKCHVSSKLVTN